jgi:hypothetical protein
MQLHGQHTACIKAAWEEAVSFVISLEKHLLPEPGLVLTLTNSGNCVYYGAEGR